MAEQAIHEQVMVRAIKDPAFRQELLSDPRAVLAREYQVHPPEHVVVRVLEDAPGTLTIVLPPRQEALLELSDVDLEAASGGLKNICMMSWAPRWWEF